MAKVPEIKPKSFTEYVQEVERLNGSAEDPIWFRGAGKSSYELIPTLYRHSQKKTVHEIAKLERDTMIRFRQRSIPFSDRSLQDDWEALFFMQHYRVPTRLLDWSENPFISFYFAVMSAKFSVKKGGDLPFSEDAAIWVLDPVKWNRHALSHQSYDGGILVTKDTELSGYQPQTMFTKMNNHPVALYGAHNSPRIVAQRGVFTIFGQNLSPMETAYDKAAFPDGALKKIVLDKAILPALRKSILSYGITESVVFPDLDGLAQEMRRDFGFEV
ncbi:FRG domain-containing protein [Ralstonia pseudosolanacearum]|nr:FRG domain-containing protein [Ralstonia pseudosolanacearum]KAF3459137.1 FRG domain-containing protein [Ralstonia solanacearum]AST88854.1 FRG domain-containing protein [Ralstonia pseudosolanacearum]MCK4129600.1 FRG domain-containing protein [Ralstonia pseudosolanacearum]NKA06641.1 FRG domain-containing protein [Ralstonia solanacearum]NKA56210.1 FRG domain-containing protein [Ralstonia solanacearum]